MIKVGLTGGIGCGKSYVADLLRRRHIPVYDTDKEAKRLMMESATIRRGLVDWVGERAYMPDGTLNRERIASYLFASPLHAERINRLEQRAKEIQDIKSKLLKASRKKKGAEDRRKKIILGALLISKSKTDMSIRKTLIKLVNLASDRDKELLNEVLIFSKESLETPPNDDEKQ